MQYSPEQIGNALTQERLGGVCYISICGNGETLLPTETFEIARRLLANGHFVNITTNGTLTRRFKDFLELPAECRERLHFAFSFHYLELKKRNILEKFFENVKLMKDAGCSFLVQLNLYDGYIPYIDEIKRVCLEHVGAYPQIAATRDEVSEREITLLTSHTREQYRQIGEAFQSPLFDFTMKNFMVKRREFCYAGAWSGVLNLADGILRQCHSSETRQNIFEDIEQPIDFSRVVGHFCCSPYCSNSSHYLSLGTIPSLVTPSYGALRNREAAGWYSPRMKEFLDGKLYNSNQEYTQEEKDRLSKIPISKLLGIKIRTLLPRRVLDKITRRLKEMVKKWMS